MTKHFYPFFFLQIILLVVAVLIDLLILSGTFLETTIVSLITISALFAFNMVLFAKNLKSKIEAAGLLLISLNFLLILFFIGGCFFFVKKAGLPLLNFFLIFVVAFIQMIASSFFAVRLINKSSK